LQLARTPDSGAVCTRDQELAMLPPPGRAKCSACRSDPSATARCQAPENSSGVRARLLPRATRASAFGTPVRCRRRPGRPTAQACSVGEKNSKVLPPGQGPPARAGPSTPPRQRYVGRPAISRSPSASSSAAAVSRTTSRTTYSP
jgi:hypothetical protein